MFLLDWFTGVLEYLGKRARTVQPVLMLNLPRPRACRTEE